MRDKRMSLKIYRWLLNLYPAAFRDNYAGLMEQEFRSELAESKGAWGIAVLWIRLLADLAVTIPPQILREFAQDGRHTLRLWARRPGHTVCAIGALAIGIGATTGGFSIVNALILRPLPFHEPRRLAAMRPDEFIPPHDSAKQFHDWRGQSAYLADATLFEQREINLGGVRNPGRAHIAQTSWNFFGLLGIKPILGRVFLPEEDTAGRNAIVVLGYGFWQQYFGGNPEVLGSTIRLDGEPLTIIGVAPPGFDYPGGAALWKPASFSPGNNGWATIVRLKPDIDWAQARAAFDADVDRVSSNQPNNGKATPRPQLRPLQDALAGSAREASLMLLAGLALLLSIACMNVANLLTTRTADRAVEISVRSALGASRARLIQQLLTECLLLSMAAAILGLLLAVWITSIASKMQPPPIAALSYSLLDARVLFFAAIVSVLSAVVFGILPSLYASRIHSFGSRGSNDLRGSRRIRETLAGVQVMLTVVLLAASVSVGRAFVHLMNIDRGFDVKSVVTVGVSLEGTRHQLDKRELPFFEDALARVRRLPGVRSASATEFLPLYADGFVGGPFGLDGNRRGRSSMMISVLSDYFATMGGQILYGREFTDAEVRSRARVAVVNERFAREYGTPMEVTGRQLTAGQQSRWTIVGVVKGMEYETDPSVANGKQVFIPSQTPGGFLSTIVVRVDGRAEEHLATIRDTIRSVDPQVPVFSVKTMEQRLADLYARPNFYRTAIWMLAAFAGLLAVIGIYGIISYAVAQRTREIGVRIAMGATPSNIRITLLWQGLLMVMAGAIPGIVIARLLGQFLRSVVEGAKPLDPATSIGVVLSLVFVAAAGIWSATNRIAGLDVAATLRVE